MIFVLDNYDSFTWNIVHYLQEIGAEVRVERHDALTAQEALATGAAGFLISPGPGRPEVAGISLDLVAACVAARRPLLGVCLGHQAIGAYFGGRIHHAPAPMHGKIDRLNHDGTGLFAGLTGPFQAVRYHSLVVAEDSLPPELVVNARSADGCIQALRHKELPVHGLQFHPESVCSDHGHFLLSNFLSIAAPAAA